AMSGSLDRRRDTDWKECAPQQDRFANRGTEKSRIPSPGIFPVLQRTLEPLKFRRWSRLGEGILQDLPLDGNLLLSDARPVSYRKWMQNSPWRRRRSIGP